jgi:uncharacterized membrane protein YgdD (TMEM256/DUF423 family)
MAAQGKGIPWGIWLALAGVNGFLSVAGGAFAAHGLQAMGDPRAVDLMEKAARYQMYGALALVVAAWLKDRGGLGRWPDLFGLFQLTGVLLFCGSLAAIALLDAPVAFLAPIGGTAMLIGWSCLAWAGYRQGRTGHP